MTSSYNSNDSRLFVSPKGNQNQSDLTACQKHLPVEAEPMFPLTELEHRQQLGQTNPKAAHNIPLHPENHFTGLSAPLIGQKAVVVQFSQK